MNNFDKQVETMNGFFAIVQESTALKFEKVKVRFDYSVYLRMLVVYHIC